MNSPYCRLVIDLPTCLGAERPLIIPPMSITSALVIRNFSISSWVLKHDNIRRKLCRMSHAELSHIRIRISSKPDELGLPTNGLMLELM